jgi:sirohydrochlorin ferrochelatase
MNAILLISHGSRSPKTKEEVLSLIETLKQKRPNDIIECAFLELESPSIPQGIDICVGKGAKKVTILLNFLNSGRHVDHDIPQIVNEAKSKHPHVQIDITKPVGQHHGISDLFLDLIRHPEHSEGSKGTLP